MQNEYRKVFRDMTSGEVKTFIGMYKPRVLNRMFMSGVLAVLEVIAMRTGDDELAEEFVKNFKKNMNKCEREAAYDR